MKKITITIAFALTACPDGDDHFPYSTGTDDVDAGDSYAPSDTTTEDSSTDDADSSEGGSSSTSAGDGSVCGNLEIEIGEECDGFVFALDGEQHYFDGNTCALFGLSIGVAFCNDECKIDLSGCSEPSCGNDIVDAGEECDGIGFSCALAGYTASTVPDGIAPCTDACTFDWSVCTDCAPPGSEGCFCLEDEDCDTASLSCGSPPLLGLPGTCQPFVCFEAGEYCGNGETSPDRCCGALTCVGGFCA